MEPRDHDNHRLACTGHAEENAMLRSMPIPRSIPTITRGTLKMASALSDGQ